MPSSELYSMVCKPKAKSCNHTKRSNRRTVVFDEYFEDFSGISLNTLRRKYEQYQNFKKTPQWVKNRHAAGKFRRVKATDRPAVLRLKDGGIVGYRVPAHFVDESLRHVQNLEEWVVEQSESRIQKRADGTRGVDCVRRYAYWVKYDPAGVPKLSQDYIRDGEKAADFFERSQLLWDRAVELFPKHHLPKIFRDLGQYELPAGQKRLCGLWMGCAVNVGSENEPVETLPHRDVQGFLHGMSCLCPFGMYSGGGVVLWELAAVVELNRGDLFFFMDHLLNHSNEKAYGARHSVVAFTEHRVWDWTQRKYGFIDARVKPLRASQKRYRVGAKKKQG